MGCWWIPLWDFAYDIEWGWTILVVLKYIFLVIFKINEFNLVKEHCISWNGTQVGYRRDFVFNKNARIIKDVNWYILCHSQDGKRWYCLDQISFSNLFHKIMGFAPGQESSFVFLNKYSSCILHFVQQHISTFVKNIL